MHFPATSIYFYRYCFHSFLQMFSSKSECHPVNTLDRLPHKVGPHPIFLSLDHFRLKLPAWLPPSTQPQRKHGFAVQYGVSCFSTMSFTFFTVGASIWKGCSTTATNHAELLHLSLGYVNLSHCLERVTFGSLCLPLCIENCNNKLIFSRNETPQSFFFFFLVSTQLPLSHQ